MTKVVCPQCGEVLVLNSIGRKSYGISFANVCKAIRDTLNSDGKPNYTLAAKKVSESLGRDVSPGFVHRRVTRAAQEQGISRENLLAEIIKGKNKTAKAENA